MNTPFIKVEGLAKRYREDQPAVFEHINFSIMPGEFVCVIGHSGCGKSTIIYKTKKILKVVFLYIL
jgi:nitrate/nitrite transport system ATP-binding protein